ncbi:MAG: toll/interleukin-1 receptor domain-containing protein [Hyphomicrobiales bacterium]
MKVFISWSGTRSNALACALKEWLPPVLNYIKPWFSESDIAAGERWAQKVGSELQDSKFGIICVTHENISSDWLLFEAGALSKSMVEGKVIPLLYGLEMSDLGGPMSQFQAKKFEENGFMEIAQAINENSEEQYEKGSVEKPAQAIWPKLEISMQDVPPNEAWSSHKRPESEVLEELVTEVRGLNSRMRNFDIAFDSRRRSIRQKVGRLHPAMFEEIVFL